MSREFNSLNFLVKIVEILKKIWDWGMHDD